MAVKWTIELTESEFVLRLSFDDIDKKLLTRRQKEVLECVRGQLQNKEIAARLEITMATVKFHIAALLKLFGVDNRRML